MLGDCLVALARIAGGGEVDEESERDMCAGAFVIADIALLHRQSLTSGGATTTKRRRR